jgi:hypothetical protein
VQPVLVETLELDGSDVIVASADARAIAERLSVDVAKCDEDAGADALAVATAGVVALCDADADTDALPRPVPVGDGRLEALGDADGAADGDERHAVMRTSPSPPCLRTACALSVPAAPVRPV